MSQIIFDNIHKLSTIVYDSGMVTIDQYLDEHLARGRAYFTRGEAQAALGLGAHPLSVALLRQSKKGRLANPRRGFYLILRPEDRTLGAPDPVRWIDPLMQSLKLDYRVTLLRAAAFHGSSHQAAMVFQVIVPRQVRAFEVGRQRVEFIYQSPSAFRQVNRSDWLGSIKSEAGFAKVAGLELTLLDCARYFHKAAGINGLAQIAQDLGGNASADVLTSIAAHYENSSVRRLGYLLERAGHLQQADALRPFARKAKTLVLLDPSVKPLVEGVSDLREKVPDWHLIINEHVEVDF